MRALFVFHSVSCVESIASWFYLAVFLIFRGQSHTTLVGTQHIPLACDAAPNHTHHHKNHVTGFPWAGALLGPYCFISFSNNLMHSIAVINSILQIRKVKIGNTTPPFQGYLADKLESWGSNLLCLL